MHHTPLVKMQRLEACVSNTLMTEMHVKQTLTSCSTIQTARGVRVALAQASGRTQDVSTKLWQVA
jgi:hypothetical protein